MIRNLYMLDQIYIYIHLFTYLKDKEGVFLENINNKVCFVNITEVWWQQNELYFI